MTTLPDNDAAALSGYGIAITRPTGQAGKLTELIRTAGGKPFAFPLIAIAPLEDYSAFDHQLTELEKDDWAIFISSNAVQNGMPRVLQHHTIPISLKFAAIGPVTASELAAFGVAQVLTPQDRFDSEALLALPEMHNVTGKRFVIFRGVGGREVLADTLKARGAMVRFAECYRRINPQTDTKVLASMWQNKQLHALVVTSSEAMRHLLALAIQDDDAAWIKHIVICVNHERIAEEARQRGLRPAVAAAPGDEAMLNCLKGALQHGPATL
ncbi:MAG TPA: uroporphyrinogen-III synthase [Methylophilaceae bacterium]|nr:uroporphyrinogen-III synthase [Methylophilaceae bacterium]